MNINYRIWLVATILGRRVAIRVQRQVAVKGECAGVSKPAVEKLADVGLWCSRMELQEQS